MTETRYDSLQDSHQQNDRTLWRCHGRLVTSRTSVTLLFCGSISTTSGLLWLWPAVALACWDGGAVRKLPRPENLDLANSTRPLRSTPPSPLSRGLGFKVRVYPNVQRACLTPNYSVGLTVGQCSALSTSMAPPPLVPTISPPTVYIMDIPTTPQPGTEFPTQRHVSTSVSLTTFLRHSRVPPSPRPARAVEYLHKQMLVQQNLGPCGRRKTNDLVCGGPWTFELRWRGAWSGWRELSL